jgi:hypothetical protein
VKPGRLGTITGTLAVASVAGYASYRHMATLARQHGQPDDLAYVLPLSVDGLMLVASIAMVSGGRPRPTVRASFLTGIAASVAGNWLAGRQGDYVGQAISAFAPIALLLLVHMLITLPRPAADQAPADVIIDQAVPDDASGLFEPLPEAPVSPAMDLPPTDTEHWSPVQWVNLANDIRARYSTSWQKTATMLGLDPRTLYNYRQQVKDGWPEETTS